MYFGKLVFCLIAVNYLYKGKNIMQIYKRVDLSINLKYEVKGSMLELNQNWARRRFN